ncbi:MAG: anti-sigma factor [Candidatus Tectimicrobiota bacterium]
MGQHPSDEARQPRSEALTCQRATALLVEYVAGELESATARAFQEHLRLCEDCVAYLRTYQATIAATRAVDYAELPEALQERLWSFLRESSGAKKAPP